MLVERLIAYATLMNERGTILRSADDDDVELSPSFGFIKFRRFGVEYTAVMR